jgi:single-strand DNA-binding protein
MSQPSEFLNQVVLVGRVSAAPETRELPSGDTVVSFRVVVDRPPTRPAAASSGTPKAGPRRQVDVIDVACWTRRAQRSAASLAADTTVRVEGALRRRFFAAAGARASRYEVEAERITRVSAARAARASSGG